MTDQRLSRIVAGLPPTVPFVGPEVMERASGAPFRVRLGANESSFGTSPRAIAAMAAELDRSSLYGDPENWDLRDALAQRFDVSPANVAVACGIDDLQSLAVRAFLDPGEVVVTSLGAYPTFNYHVAGGGGRLEPVPYKDDANDVDALLRRAHETDARMLFLANPDNPTGSWLDGAEVARLLDGLPSRTILILDEAYLEFGPATGLPLDVDDPRLIRFRTFSKAYGMAGLRIGYALGERSALAAFDRVRLHFGVNRIAQAGALAALADEEFLQCVVAAVAEGRDDYYGLATRLGFRAIPSQANFVSFDLGDRARAVAALAGLIRRGVFARMPGQPPLDRCVRITVGTEPERAIVAEAFADVLAELAAADAPAAAD